MDSLKTILEWHSINESYNKDNFEVWNGERTKLRSAAVAFGPLGVALARMFGNMKRYPSSGSGSKWFSKRSPKETMPRRKEKTSKVKAYNPNEHLNSGPVLPERL